MSDVIQACHMAWLPYVSTFLLRDSDIFSASSKMRLLQPGTLHSDNPTVASSELTGAAGSRIRHRRQATDISIPCFGSDLGTAFTILVRATSLPVLPCSVEQGPTGAAVVWC